MSELVAVGDKPYKYPFKQDPDEGKYYSFAWGAAVRLNQSEYLLDEVVVPDVANGLKYVCVNPGVTAAAEPDMATELDELTVDGTVTWQAKAYDLMMRRGDSFQSTAWTVDVAGVTLSDSGSDGPICWVKVSAIPSGTVIFTLTNTVEILRVDAKVETYERSIKVKVATL